MAKPYEWTEGRDSSLKENHPTKTIKELSVLLNTSRSVICRRIKFLNIKNKCHNFTVEEDWIIFNRYHLNGADPIAKLLNLNSMKIWNRAKHLKIKRYKSLDGFKLCTVCHIEKSTKEYQPSKLGKFNVSSQCRKCCENKRKTKHLANLEESREKNRIKTKTYYNKNLKRSRERNQEWRNKNKEKIHLQCRKRYNEKYKTNPKFNIRTRLTALVRQSLHGLRKADKTLNLIGLRPKEFIEYFKSKMTPNMTWEDVMTGKIHIDHIIPCKNFDLTIPEDQKKCFNYTNLQPLWATTDLAIKNGDINMIGNLNKGAKIINLQVEEKNLPRLPLEKSCLSLRESALPVVV